MERVVVLSEGFAMVARHDHQRGIEEARSASDPSSLPSDRSVSRSAPR